VVRRAGGDGEGPGEFRAITSFLTVRGDTLTVYDTRLGRLTVLDPRGAVVGSTDRLALTVVDVDGREIMRIEGTGPNRPVSDDDVDRWRADRLMVLSRTELAEEIVQVLQLGESL